MAFIQSILLVDDDADDQLFFTDALQEIDTNIKCVIANNGKDALERLKNPSDLPDILFLDLNMPFLNGYEFLKHFRNEKHLQEIPVIIFTTSNDRKDADLARQLGANLFFSKPNEFNQLCSKLAQILDIDFKKSRSSVSHNSF